jgi:hypothetical protein
MITEFFDYMTTISKNIYNCTLYCYKVYKQFEDNIYQDLYNDIIKNKYVDTLGDVIKNKVKVTTKIKNKDNTGKRDKKDKVIIKIEQKLYEIYDMYYNFYTLNKKIIDNNNKIIFKFIIDNIDDYKNKIIKFNDIIFNDNNEKLVIDNIINGILNSLYYKNIYYIKKLLDINQEKKIEIKYTHIIESIKNNTFYIENNCKYSHKIKNELGIPITSIQNLIGRVSLTHLNENKEKIPSDVIGNIINKMYCNIISYYDLLRSGTQKNISFCKYLNKDDRFNLFYYCRSFKVEENKIRLNVGDYINKNYGIFNKIYYDKIQIKKTLYYYDKNKLVDKKLNKNHIKIDNKFIDKSGLIKFNYIYLNLPNKIKDNNIKLIEIKSNKYAVKVCITYEIILNNLQVYNLSKFNKLGLEDKMEKCISIDTGIVNLLTIYNPTGSQHIIKGNK